MKSFHKTMGYMSAVFLLMIIISISIASSYMSRHNISFPELFSDSNTISQNTTNNISFWDSGKKSSSYETIHISESESFNLVEEIFISAATEEIMFIEEDRDNILVEYYRELPDTNNYEVNYKTTTSHEKLSISTTLKSKNLSINKIYNGSIEIHVPFNYEFDKITIDSGAAKITSSNIYTNTKSLSAIASFGDIDIDIDLPINEVIVSCNFGSIEINVNEEIEILDINCDMGQIYLNINAYINELDINEDMGDVEVYATAELGDVYVENNMGAIEVEFLEFVKSIYIENNMGDIIAIFHKNDDMNIYINTDLGSINSDFPTISSRNTDYEFTNNMGSIDVQCK